MKHKEEDISLNFDKLAAVMPLGSSMVPRYVVQLLFSDN
jgi:hypothetical protein